MWSVITAYCQIVSFDLMISIKNLILYKNKENTEQSEKAYLIFYIIIIYLYIKSL